MLLYHGTNRVNALGIIKQGSKASTKGKHGPGVYLTECASCAIYFSTRKLCNWHDNIIDNLVFVLVNEITDSASLKQVVIDEDPESKPDILKK